MENFLPGWFWELLHKPIGQFTLIDFGRVAIAWIVVAGGVGLIVAILKER